MMALVSTSMIAAARDWMGAPFLHRGYSKLGCDCIGLLIGACGPLVGIDPAKFMERYHYARWPDQHVLLAGLNDACEFVAAGPKALAKARAGAVLLFRVDGRPQHLAMLTAPQPSPTLIHGYARKRMVVEHRLDDDWRAVLLGVWSFKVN